MLWGYALVWTKGMLARDPDPIMARLKFLAHYGLQTTGFGLSTFEHMSDADRDRVGSFVADNDLSLTLIAEVPYMDPDHDVVRRAVERNLEGFARYRDLLRTRLITTSAGNVHRFMREPSLQSQMERLADVLPALALGCHDLGLPFGIENHGDYYTSDLVELCKAIPHLGIFLDTGNTYLIGEAPLPAVRTAAPYVVGTHFKDHHVRPRLETRPLQFEVGPSVIGQGDVDLRTCYQILLDHAPNPRDLVMEIELIPPPELDAIDAFEQSLAFIRSLPEPK